MPAAPLLPVWRRLDTFDRRIRGSEPFLTVLHLQPSNLATPILLARIREDALRSGWNHDNAHLLAAPPSLTDDDEALREALDANRLVGSALGPGWARVLLGVQQGAAWGIVETSRSSAFAMQWLSPSEKLGAGGDGARLQADLRAIPLPPQPRLLLRAPPGASAHDRLRAAALLKSIGSPATGFLSLVPEGVGGMEIRQAPGLRALLLLDRHGRPTTPLLLADVPICAPT